MPPTSPATGSIRPGSAVRAGRSISKVLLGFDRSGGTGGYRGYVDDLRIG
ncbi:hypothetical protein AB0I51_12010 [Streptomyces sp. NPDC050549]